MVWKIEVQGRKQEGMVCVCVCLWLPCSLVFFLGHLRGLFFSLPYRVATDGESCRWINVIDSYIWWQCDFCSVAILQATTLCYGEELFPHTLLTSIAIRGATTPRACSRTVLGLTSTVAWHLVMLWRLCIPVCQVGYIKSGIVCIASCRKSSL